MASSLKAESDNQILENKNLIQGTDKAEVLNGTSGDDFIFASSGNDTLNGKAGNDILVGGDGNDRLFGHNGDDLLNGGTGSNYLNGGKGNDRLFAGLNSKTGYTPSTEKATLEDLSGNNQFAGSTADDKFKGGSGNDIYMGFGGNDRFDDAGGKNIFVYEFTRNEGHDTIFAKGENKIFVRLSQKNQKIDLFFDENKKLFSTSILNQFKNQIDFQSGKIQEIVSFIGNDIVQKIIFDPFKKQYQEINPKTNRVLRTITEDSTKKILHF